MAGSLLDQVAEVIAVDRFEYHHLVVDVSELATPAFDERLALLGRDGWQLVSTIGHERHGYSHAIHLIFMRRMP